MGVISANQFYQSAPLNMPRRYGPGSGGRAAGRIIWPISPLFSILAERGGLRHRAKVPGVVAQPRRPLFRAVAPGPFVMQQLLYTLFLLAVFTFFAVLPKRRRVPPPPPPLRATMAAAASPTTPACPTSTCRPAFRGPSTTGSPIITAARWMCSFQAFQQRITKKERHASTSSA